MQEYEMKGSKSCLVLQEEEMVNICELSLIYVLHSRKCTV